MRPTYQEDERHALAALLVRNGGHLRPVRRLPRMAHPTRIAARYFARLRRGPLATLRSLIEDSVPRLRAVAERHLRTDAAEDEEIGEILDELADRFADRWSRANFEKLIQPVISDTDKFHARQLNRVLAPMLGVDVVGNEPHLRPILERATKENVALIKKLPSTFFAEIEAYLTREIANGNRWEEMADFLGERFGVTESRANLIARDQTGKLYGKLNEVRQTGLGISGYVWRTMGDNRVREEHEARAGEVFAWDKPPPDGQPGQPVQCRCYAEPDLRQIIAQARGEG